MDDVSVDQLQALAGVGALLDAQRIAHWVFGGWAVDFHAGVVTRAHDDVDVAVWMDDRERVARLLEGDGWRHAPSEDDDGGTGYERGKVRLELTYLVGDRDGAVFTPLRHGRASWPDGAFGDEVRELFGVRARVIGRAALARGKSSPRDDPDDASKDRADFGVLSALEEPGSS
ncbi:MAG TPA: hypothetical protein VHJ34_12435 [Actinomycetota bacterium]|nr:hypothetical protein [Actinomycetota bacterium]